MANTVTRRKGVVAITAMDSDWAWTDTFTGSSYTEGINLHSIQFKPGAADDVLIVRAGSITGPPIVDWKSADEYDGKQFPCDGMKMEPVIDFSECTLSAGHSITLVQWTKPEGR